MAPETRLALGIRCHVGVMVRGPPGCPKALRHDWALRRVAPTIRSPSTVGVGYVMGDLRSFGDRPPPTAQAREDGCGVLRPMGSQYSHPSTPPHGVRVERFSPGRRGCASETSLGLGIRCRVDVRVCGPAGGSEGTTPLVRHSADDRVAVSGGCWVCVGGLESPSGLPPARASQARRDHCNDLGPMGTPNGGPSRYSSAWCGSTDCRLGCDFRTAASR